MSFPLDFLKQYVSLKPGPGEQGVAFNGEAVEHLTSLYNFALGMAKNQDDAADLVQETYLSALRIPEVPGSVRQTRY